MSAETKDRDLQWYLPPNAFEPGRDDDQLCLAESGTRNVLTPQWLETAPLAVRSDAEVIGILLDGRAEPQGDARAQDLLDRLGGLRGLLKTDEVALLHLAYPQAEVSRLAAARELACRFARCQVSEEAPLAQTRELARYIGLRYQTAFQNVLGALFLDASGRLLAIREIYRGTPYRCSIEPAPILREALLLKASNLVIFLALENDRHEANQSEREAAFLISSGCASIGIRLHGFLVVTAPDRWCSVYP